MDKGNLYDLLCIKETILGTIASYLDPVDILIEFCRLAGK